MHYECTFFARTDNLARALRCNVEDLPEIIGISRRTLFACRKSDSKVTPKTLGKLEAAESRAGITMPEHIPKKKSRKSMEHTEKADGDTLANLLNLLNAIPESIKEDALAKTIEGLFDIISNYYIQSTDLAEEMIGLLNQNAMNTDKAADLSLKAQKVNELKIKAIKAANYLKKAGYDISSPTDNDETE